MLPALTVDIGMLRNCVWTLVVLSTVAAPASANQAFQIFGGMAGGETSSASFDQSFPEALLHKTVSFSTSYEPGTVIVRTGERKLYYVLPDGEAVEYNVGVGREGFAWTGANRVSQKAEWPAWRPPREMIEREAAHGRTIPKFVAGGPGNPLGARAI